MNRRGFTLVEMLIVLAIVGIILSIAIPQYGQYMRRRNMEKEIREIQSVISGFRLSAQQLKERRRILIGPNLLHFQRFNADPAINAWQPALNAAPPAGSTPLPADMPLTYSIQRLTGGALVPFNIAVDLIEFDERGYANDFNLVTIVVVPVDTNIGDGCIIVDRAKSNVGRMINATTCQ